MSSAAWLVPWFRRLREDRVGALALVLFVLVTAFIAAATPRALDRAGDAALRNEVASQPSSVRNIQLVEERRISPGPTDPLGSVDVVGERRQREMPMGLQSLITSRASLVESPLWRVRSATLRPSSARIRFQRGIESRMRYTAGRPPTSRSRTQVATDPTSGQPAEFATFESAISGRSARALGVAVGDTILLTPEPSDSLTTGHDDHVALEIVGTFDLADPGDSFWFDDRSLEEPTIRALTNDIDFVTIVGLLAPEAYVPFMRATNGSELPVRYTWRYTVDSSALDADRMDALIGDLRRLESTFSAIQSRVGAAQGTLLRTGLLRVVTAHAARWQSAQSVLTVSVIGPAAVAAAALVLVAVLAARRRRRMLAVWRARGATVPQLGLAAVLETLVLAAPPAFAALAIAILLLASGATLPSVAAAVVVCAAAAIAALVTISRAAASGRDPVRESRGVRLVDARRIVLEAVIVVGAIVAAYLLRERGLRGSSSAGRLTGADPLIAAVPVLVAIAAAIVGVRLLPVPLALLSRLSARRRDLVPVLALRRSTREGSAAPVLLVLLVTATIGAFSSATLVNLDRASDALAWHEVGAPYRLTNSDRPLPVSLDASRVPGVEAVAGAFRSLVSVRRSGQFELLALDVARFQSVNAGTGGAVAMPAEFGAVSVEPFPAIVSAALAADRDGIKPGDVFALTVAGQATQFRAVETRQAFPTLPPNGRFAIVSREALEAVNARERIPTTDLFIRAPEDSGAPVRTAIRAALPGGTLESRADRAAALRTSPVVTTVFLGVALATLVSGAYAALAVAASLALAAAARATETAQLRTIGLARRDVVALVVAEHGPTVASAFAAGTLLGLGLFLILREALGLGAVVGSSLTVPLQVEPLHLGLLLAAIAGIVAVGIAIAAALERQALPATAIRRPIE